MKIFGMMDRTIRLGLDPFFFLCGHKVKTPDKQLRLSDTQRSIVLYLFDALKLVTSTEKAKQCIDIVKSGASFYGAPIKRIIARLENLTVEQIKEEINNIRKELL